MPASARDSAPASGPTTSSPTAKRAPANDVPSLCGLGRYTFPRLEWTKGEPIPPGYVPAKEMRSGLVIGGAITLGASYLFGGLLPGAAVIGGGCSIRQVACAVGGTLMIPVVGPFISIAPLASSESTGLGALYALLVFDGLVQIAGATLLLYGILAQRDYLLRKPKVRGRISWMATPMLLGEAGRGIGVVGRF
jgi:hypothetical protein